MSKAQLRSEALVRRKAITAAEAAVLRAHLAREGMALLRGRPAGIASLYWPILAEADPRALLEALANAGIATALPVTVSRAAPLLFRLWKPGDPLVPGQMRIPEPAAHLPECHPDILFIPLAAFDRRGYRIGYGAGHYDRALASLRANKPVLAVGIAYATQEVPEVPAEPHDQRLDFVLTERETISCRL